MSASSPGPHLIARMKDGDDLAFAQLVERHALPLRVLIRQIARGATRADYDEDDMFQLVLFRAWQLRAAFVEDEPGGFHRWLAAMARNVLRERLRYLESKGRDEARKHLRAASMASAIPESITSIGSRSARKEDADRLEVAIAELDPAARELIQLYYLEGLPLSALAEATGRARSSLWDELKKALAGLRAALPSD